jgi:hypothetical protein
MLSDVLSDALAEIERYRTDTVFAGCYADPALSAKLDAMTGLMEEVLRELDTPPSPLGGPAIEAVEPSTGPAGTRVRITGSGFTAATVVDFAGMPTLSPDVQSATELFCRVPPRPAGRYAVRIVNDRGAAIHLSGFVVTPGA